MFARVLDLEMRQRTKGCKFFVLCLNVELFAVPPAKRFLLCAPVAVIWNAIERLLLLCVPSVPCLTYFSGVLFCDDDCSAQRFKQTVVLTFVVLMLSVFFRTVRHGVTA